jgi:hypothetical protein
MLRCTLCGKEATYFFTDVKRSRYVYQHADGAECDSSKVKAEVKKGGKKK